MTTYSNVTLRQRRDNDYNYERVKNTFIPARGEIILVDTAQSGLRAKIGDGISTYAQLEFIDQGIAANIIIRGYLSNNEFYLDEVPVTPNENCLYLDIKTNVIYFYKEETFISTSAATATEQVAGVVRLYQTIGENEDGTMTQKAISAALQEKVSIKTDTENELLTFIGGIN